jgi:hypothetical protein
MRGGGCSDRVLGYLANEYSCANGAQINFGDITPYFTYVRPYPATILSKCTTHHVSPGLAKYILL